MSSVKKFQSMLRDLDEQFEDSKKNATVDEINEEIAALTVELEALEHELEKTFFASEAVAIRQEIYRVNRWIKFWNGKKSIRVN